MPEPGFAYAKRAVLPTRQESGGASLFVFPESCWAETFLYSVSGLDEG